MIDAVTSKIRHLYWVAFVVAGLLWTSEGSAADRVDRYFQRPAAHSFLGSIGTNTRSYASRTLSWPGGAACSVPLANCLLEFDYFVDSEAGWDFLRVYVDGVAKFSLSGRYQIGRARIAVSGGSHLVQIQYEKDGSVDAGQDTAWVDNLATLSADGASDSFDFLERDLVAPPGWTPGGYGGGWVVAVRPARKGIARPAGHAFLGYQLNPTTSWIQRSITLPTPGRIDVRFFVDSEVNYDFMRVYLNGNLAGQVSGRYRSGTISANVALAGTYTLRIEYYKDTSVDVGLDLARVDFVRYLNTAGVAYMEENFDNEPSGSLPVPWTAGGTASGWKVGPVAPPLVFLTQATPTTFPTVDGNVDNEALATKEYEDPTLLPISDFGATKKATLGGLWLQPRHPTSQLYFGLRLVSGTVGLGNEKGDLELFFDGNHFNTLTGQGECASVGNPSASDRRIVFHYEMPVGQGTPTVTQVTHYAGNCTGSWVSASSIPFTVVARERTDNPGWLDIEAVIGLASFSGFFNSAGYLGFAMTHKGTPFAGGTQSYEHVPGLDSVPITTNVTTWATLRLANSHGTPIEAVDNWMEGAPNSADMDH